MGGKRERARHLRVWGGGARGGTAGQQTAILSQTRRCEIRYNHHSVPFAERTERQRRRLRQRKGSMSADAKERFSAQELEAPNMRRSPCRTPTVQGAQRIGAASEGAGALARRYRS